MNQEKKTKNENKKLKPVVFVNGYYNYHNNNELQQNILLKALQITTNPQELRQMIGVKTVAEVYRTLDKLSIRKEYHLALERQGLDLDTIIGGIKNEGKNSKNSGVRLKAWTTLLKSLGLDEYKESESQGSKTWEDTLRDIVEKEKNQELPKPKPIIYEVEEPEIPDYLKTKLEEDEKSGKELYGKY